MADVTIINSRNNSVELTIAILFFVFGFSLCVPVVLEAEKQSELNDIKHQKVEELLFNDWKWKRDRLRVYTDLIYNTRYK